MISAVVVVKSDIIITVSDITSAGVIEKFIFPWGNVTRYLIFNIKI